MKRILILALVAILAISVVPLAAALRVDQPVQASFAVEQLGSSPTFDIIDNPGTFTTGERAAFISDGFTGSGHHGGPLPKDVRQIVAINCNSFVLGGFQEAWLGGPSDPVLALENNDANTSLTVYLMDRNASSNNASATPGDLIDDWCSTYPPWAEGNSASYYYDGGSGPYNMGLYHSVGSSNLFIMELLRCSDSSVAFTVKVRGNCAGSCWMIETSGTETLAAAGGSVPYYLHLKTNGGYYGPGAGSNDHIHLILEVIATGT